jgi:hypothetical protein
MKKRMRRLKPLLLMVVMLREREKENRVAVRRQTVTRKRKLRRVTLVLKKAVMEVCFILIYFRNTINMSLNSRPKL